LKGRDRMIERSNKTSKSVMVALENCFHEKDTTQIEQQTSSESLASKIWVRVLNYLLNVTTSLVLSLMSLEKSACDLSPTSWLLFKAGFLLNTLDYMRKPVMDILGCVYVHLKTVVRALFLLSTGGTRSKLCLLRVLAVVMNNTTVCNACRVFVYFETWNSLSE
jgi:hypothetical protein